MRQHVIHWILLAFGALMLVGALLVNGFVHGTVGEAPGLPNHGGKVAPRSVTQGGAVIRPDGTQTQTARLPAKTIALTFDDGPDPEWTPKILDVLAKHGAHAAFFVMGGRVAENPGLTRRIVREGHEIGNHTYTHVDMTTAPAWRNDLELNLTQRALAGAAGIKTNLMRMPYSSTPAGTTTAQWRAAEQAGRNGYIVVLADRDTKDWDHPSVASIVESAVTAEQRGEGAIVMLHDSGGDRSATVAAVDQIISTLQPQGYKFTTLAEALKLPEAEQASKSEKAIGWVLVSSQRFSGGLLEILGWLFGIGGVLCLLRMIVLLGFAHIHVRRVRRPRPIARVAEQPPLSVIVPAYNEEAGIASTLASLIDTDYEGPLEIIVVDDGSTDNTAQIVESLLLPGVKLIRKDNGGKPSALNAGIAQADGAIMVMVDGDTVFQRDTLRQIVEPFADVTVGAVSGNTKVANRGGILGRWQHIEYVIGFNLDRRMFDLLQCMPTVPGAIGAFRRDALIKVGGVSHDTLAEDTDLTMAISRAGWRVVYEETAIAWTEAPSSLRQLWRQRYRWCYGTLQAMWKHRGAMTDKSPFGRRCLTYLVTFQVLLPLIAPAADILAVYGLLFLDPVKTIQLWVLFVLAQMAAGAYALHLDHEPVRPLWTLPLQQFVYRQLMYLVVIRSLATAILGARLRWQTIHRTGTRTAAPPRSPVLQSSRGN
jgi:cellulose synthase/poly-beta-1,6-N-acetylglucosamine synthase-like glycosyltransferase/peptidoglycan/xylan/chitin deacetylase (PgdA/CDA1 family)